MKFNTSFLALVLIFLLGSCTAPEPEPSVHEEKLLPQWYLVPPNSSETYLYGAGEGSTHKKAIRSALENMASKLGISIASHYTSTLSSHTVYREYVSKSITSNIQSEVAGIRISNYEVIKSVQWRYNRFIVLVRSDRNRFAKSLVSDIDRKMNRIKNKETLVRTGNAITRYRFYAESSETINTMFPTLLVLSTLSDSFDDSPYLIFAEKINHDFQTLKNSITFSLQGDRHASGFIEALRVSLTDQHFKVIRHQASGNNHIIIDLRTAIKNSRAYDIYIAKTILDISVKDNKNTVIGGNRVTINAQALQSKEAALDNAAKKLQAMLKKEGVEKILGIPLFRKD